MDSIKIKMGNLKNMNNKNMHKINYRHPKSVKSKEIKTNYGKHMTFYSLEASYPSLLK